MAIQMRRGNYADYDESKIRPGEWAVATDTERVFIGMANGAVEMAKKSDVDAMADTAEEAILDAKAKALATIYGSLPTTVSTVAQMVDHDLTYIYSGSETGYTAGHWYYWDGTAWADGGQYVDKSKTNAPIIYSTASGAVASFSDGADDYPVKGLTVAVEPKQSGSGDPSPTNTRPISGFDTVEVMRTGKNLFDKSKYMNLVSEHDYVDGLYLCNRIQLKPNTTYTISFSAETTSTTILLINEYSHVNERGFIDLRGVSGVATYTTGDEGYLYIGVYYNTTDTSVNNRLNACDIQIELGSTATDYEPYTSKEYTISIGDTVYGGTLDVTNGKMVVDRASFLVGDANWIRYSTAGAYRFKYVPQNIKSGSNVSVNKSASSAYKLVTFTSLPSSINCFSDSANSAGQISVYDADYVNATADEFKSGRSDVRFVYELATPIEIPLTSTQINTLLGVNNVYSNAGSVEVEYPADTKQFILNAIASALA